MAVMPIGNSARLFAKRYIVIQKFKINGLIANLHPGKKQFRNSIKCFNIVIKQIINRLIALCL